MKHDTNSIKLNRVLTLTIAMVSLCIALGLATSLRMKGDMLSKGIHLINNISSDGVTFSDAVWEAIRMHLWYTVATLLISGGYPGVVLPGIYIVFKTFSLGVTLGLAAKGCVFIKALSICLAVFVSNILVLPLYIIMFFVSLRFAQKLRYAPNIRFAKEYFAFFGKATIVFLAMCIGECVQSALGILIVNTLM